MRTYFARCFLIVIAAGLASAHLQAAGVDEANHHRSRHHKYRLVELGTFGGPVSFLTSGATNVLMDNGNLVGYANTAVPDPYPEFCFQPDCFVSHAFEYRKGVLHDLGVLPRGASSQANWVSQNGLIAGASENGKLDPQVAGFPELRAVLWNHGAIVDLGTLPGGHESFATSVNNRGAVSGFATNSVPDNYSIIGFPVETRAFLWRPGTGMLDLGTLGGKDAFATAINENNQIAGDSYVNNRPNATTGLPTQHPFLWQNGVMTDLGSLGGTLETTVGVNNHGDVIGQSNLAGDVYYHPFLWRNGTGMVDLGTLGGHNGVTNWINDQGEISGKADLPGPDPQAHDAVLWRQGKMIDLGVLPGDACSNAYFVNDRGQVVGTSEDSVLCAKPAGEHAFLWEAGGPMVDLNLLVPPHPNFLLTYAIAINDRGEIAGYGVPQGCKPEDYESCGRAYILEPDGDCDDAMEAQIQQSQ